MALEVMTRKRRARKIVVYDFEWVPGTLQMRICGVFDGVRGYRSYRSVEDFLNSELTHSNRGAWFYAHAGGLADVQFVLQVLRKNPDYHVDASFSGSSATIVRVTRGHNVWTFCDSYWLLHDKLANIAKWVGMEKGGPKNEGDLDDEEVKEWYASVPYRQLKSYNELDCKILWTAIDSFESRLLSFGGELMMTLASCAMSLFRRKYLTRTIETSTVSNSTARQAYIASRVEVYGRSCENALYYDINSSFPFAMTLPVPGELTGISKCLPDEGLYLADVDIEIPDCYLPPVPVRLAQSIYFPTGRWRSWLSGIDIDLLRERGGKILKAHQVMEYEPFHDLSAYAQDLYTRRKNSSDEMEKMVYKLLLNSLYGKFAEVTQKLRVHINPDIEVLSRLSIENMMMPGIYFEEVEAKIPHEHVPIAVYITARARATIFRYLAQSVDEGKRIYYCDTDGFATQRTYETSNELGGLKLEAEIKKGWFYRPKVYRIDDKVKAKGFSLRWEKNNPKMKERAIASFERVVNYERFESERFRRIRENIRRGSLDPIEEVRPKKLSRKYLDKRPFLPDGNTRPWEIGELKKKLRVA